MFAAGQEVHIRPEHGSRARGFGFQTLIVERKLDKNYLVHKKEGGDGRGLRVPPLMLAEGPWEGGTVIVEPIPTLVNPGTVVRFKGDLYVVCAAESNGHRLFKLGGAKTWWRSVQASQFEVVSLVELAAILNTVEVAGA